jgi:hypothetical protein
MSPTAAERDLRGVSALGWNATERSRRAAHAQEGYRERYNRFYSYMFRRDEHANLKLVICEE